MANWWPLIGLWAFAAVISTWALRRERRKAADRRTVQRRDRVAKRAALGSASPAGRCWPVSGTARAWGSSSSPLPAPWL